MDEVRPPLGRPADLAGERPVALLLKGDNWRFREELKQRLPIAVVPWNIRVRQGRYDLPEMSAKFFGKELGPELRKAWVNGALGEEALTCEQRMARALGVYDWTIETKPAAVVTWTDAYPECRAALMAARDLNIPAIELVHGGFHQYTHGHWDTKAFSTHKLGSWEYREWHRFYGLSGEVIPTGLTNMDIWARADVRVLRASARHELRIPEQARVVCYLGDCVYERTPWQDEAMGWANLLQFCRSYRLAMEMVPDLHIIFKKHPYEIDKTAQFYHELFAEKMKIKENYTIIDDNLPLALAASDLTAGARSSAMVSGLMLGIPALIIDFLPFFEEWAYKGRGFTWARRPEEILSQLVHVFTDQNRMDSLIDETEAGARWFSGAQDGWACERAASAIEKLVAGGEVGEECYCQLP